MPYAPPRHNANRTKRNRKAQQQEYNKQTRTGQAFYNSGQWRRLRNWFIKSNPLCILCKGAGHTTMAAVVDHITPIKAGGNLLSSDNLQSLCHLHHNQKTAAENNTADVQHADR